MRHLQHTGHLDSQRGMKIELLLLAAAFTWYPDFMLRRRAAMAEERQVNTKIVLFDGNMKLSGRICGRPHAELQHSSGLDMSLVHCCSAQTAYKKRRCSTHVVGDVPAEEHEAPQAEVVTRHRRSRRLWPGMGEPYDVFVQVRQAMALPGRWIPAWQATSSQLDEYWKNMEQTGQAVPLQSSASDLGASVCRTHKEGQRRARANGWLLACTPDGFALHAKAYYGSESLPQRHFFLAELVTAYPEAKIIIHDDACHIRKFAINTASGLLSRNDWRTRICTTSSTGGIGQARPKLFDSCV